LKLFRKWFITNISCCVSYFREDECSCAHVYAIKIGERVKRNTPRRRTRLRRPRLCGFFLREKSVPPPIMPRHTQKRRRISSRWRRRKMRIVPRPFINSHDAGRVFLEQIGRKTTTFSRIDDVNSGKKTVSCYKWFFLYLEQFTSNRKMSNVSRYAIAVTN
jgi:hypothetical protein